MLAILFTKQKNVTSTVYRRFTEPKVLNTFRVNIYNFCGDHIVLDYLVHCLWINTQPASTITI